MNTQTYLAGVEFASSGSTSSGRTALDGGSETSG